jgi:hypothetical protein
MIRVDFGAISETVYIDIILNTDLPIVGYCVFFGVMFHILSQLQTGTYWSDMSHDL